MFTANTMNVLDRHNPAEPLFLFHAFHQIHTPLEVSPLIAIWPPNRLMRSDSLIGKRNLIGSLVPGVRPLLQCT